MPYFVFPCGSKIYYRTTLLSYPFHILPYLIHTIFLSIRKVRHPDQATLKRLKNLPLMLIRKMSSSLSVPVHASMMSVSTAGKPPPALLLRR